MTFVLWNDFKGRELLMSQNSHIKKGAQSRSSLTLHSVLYALGNFWMKIGPRMARITTPILMGAFFFIVLSPWAVLFRRFNPDVLMQDDRLQSTLKDAPVLDVRERFKFPF